MAKTKSADKTANAALAAPSTKQYSKEQLLWWYDLMLLMRNFEQKAGLLYSQRKIRGFCHLYIGQEAVGAGIESAMRKDDYLITAYRDHGNALARGVSARAVMAELYGKATGCTSGKGGSMHMFSAENNFMGGHGIVGAQIPIGAGAAFAAKYRGEDRVCVCMFGDGAARQGSLHETFNLAMLWKLPVIFICENNNYAMGTSVERTSNVTDIYKLGAAYEMPSYPVNGMDVRAVHEAMTDAIAHARAGNGPVFLEMKTYRYQGHSMSDPGKYRTREEVNEYKERDPIAQLASLMLETNTVTEAELNAIEDKVNAIVQDAVDFSEQSPWPDPAEVYKAIYVGDYPFLME
jgi:pyruvate dehydrogenase E1 component alpha subunit